MTEKRKKGRPRKEPTKVISRRVKAVHAEKLSKMFDEIIRQNDNITAQAQT